MCRPFVAFIKGWNLPFHNDQSILHFTTLWPPSARGLTQPLLCNLIVFKKGFLFSWGNEALSVPAHFLTVRSQRRENLRLASWFRTWDFHGRVQYTNHLANPVVHILFNWFSEKHFFKVVCFSEIFFSLVNVKIFLW